MAALSIIVTIITVTASGVLAALIAYRLSATKEQVFFMRKKVEELYLSVERYDKLVGAHFITYYSILKNEIDYDQLLDLQISHGERIDKDSASASEMVIMLINIYYPTLITYLDRYNAARDRIHKIVNGHKRAYKRGDTDGSPWFSQFHIAMKEHIEAGKLLKDAVIAEAVKLARAEELWPSSLTLAALSAKVSRNVDRLKKSHRVLRRTA